MRQGAKNWMVLIYIFFFLIFSFLSIKYGRYAADQLSNVSARYKEDTLTPREFTAALKNMGQNGEKTLELTLWNRLKKEKAENELTGLQAETNVIEVYGNMKQVIPMEFLYGRAVTEDDLRMCVLDSVTAWNLFGTVSAVGNRVIWNERKYTVKGIIKTSDTVIIIPVSDIEHKFSNLEAVYGRKHGKRIEDQGRQLINFMKNNGIEEPDTLIDGSFLAYLLTGFYHLSLWILAVQLIYFLVKTACMFRNHKFLCFLVGLAAVSSVFILVQVTEFHIQLPSQLIPGKWSDFDFYVSKYKEWKAAVLNINNNNVLPKDKICTYYSNRCMFYGFLSAGMLIPVQFWLIRFFKSQALKS
ncbi:ABC transporter permease [Anaerocolumna sp. MB42-C2]|uniref:ABC transporter permease n=1 Tax=Anaerocolumna sp. MB42-C2 TaxID=3070997 RepID=UPI0027E0FB41|nr:ABC transporter permease [Anaerocolumna sp. MB42-C2]WMJ87701.1 ABC transporter permease [Anaerocolumna sp. MB42-C2]